MYKLQILTKQEYIVATFQAGYTMKEANAFYKAFVKCGLYQNYIKKITYDN